MKNSSTQNTQTIQSKPLIEILKDHNLTPVELAKSLGINTGQIYRWNKNGILKTNPHFRTLKKLFPELQPKDTRARLNGDEDLRSYNKRPNTPLVLDDVDMPSYVEQEFKSTLHPNIKFKDEWGLPYVPVEKRDRDWYEKRKELPKKKGIKW